MAEKTFKSLGLGTFQEADSQSLLIDALVFINGVDVTQYLEGSVTVTRAGRGGMGTAQITLSNAGDAFVITPENIQVNLTQLALDYMYAAAGQKPSRVQWRVGDAAGPYSEAAKKSMYDYKTKRNADLMGDEEFSTEMRKWASKTHERFNVVIGQWLAADAVQRAMKEAAEKFEKDGRSVLSGAFDINMVEARLSKAADALAHPDKRKLNLLWEIGPHVPILHKYDPVRMFVHNPMSSEDQWMPLFCGAIDTVSFSDGYAEGGPYTMSVSCNDIRAQMERMRVQTNVLTYLDVPNVQAPLMPFGKEAGVFKDILTGKGWTKIFAGVPFFSAIELMVVGGGLKVQRDEIPLATVSRDIGYVEVTTRPAAEGELSTRTVTVDVVGESPDGTARVTIDTSTRHEVRETKIDGLGDFTTGYILAFPQGKTKTKRTMEFWHTLCLFGVEHGSGNEKRLGWYSKSECMAIGKGSTHTGPFSPFAMNLHMLLPGDGVEASFLQEFDVAATGSSHRDWTNRLILMNELCEAMDYEWHVSPFGDIVVEFPCYDFYPSDFGEYGPTMIFDKHLTDVSINEWGNFPTVLVITGAYSFQKITMPTGALPQAIAWSPVTVFRYGVEVEQIVKPFMLPLILKGEGETNAHRMTKARALAILEYLARIEYQKRIAESSSVSFGFAYRPFLLPNRPVLVAPRMRLAVTRSTTISLQINDTATTSLDAAYMRRMDAAGEWVSITGYPNSPMPYRAIFDSVVAGLDFNTMAAGFYPMAILGIIPPLYSAGARRVHTPVDRAGLDADAESYAEDFRLRGGLASRSGRLVGQRRKVFGNLVGDGGVPRNLLNSKFKTHTFGVTTFLDWSTKAAEGKFSHYPGIPESLYDIPDGRLQVQKSSTRDTPTGVFAHDEHLRDVVIPERVASYSRKQIITIMEMAGYAHDIPWQLLLALMFNRTNSFKAFESAATADSSADWLGAEKVEGAYYSMKEVSRSPAHSFPLQAFIMAYHLSEAYRIAGTIREVADSLDYSQWRLAVSLFLGEAKPDSAINISNQSDLDKVTREFYSENSWAVDKETGRLNASAPANLKAMEKQLDGMSSKTEAVSTTDADGNVVVVRRRVYDSSRHGSQLIDHTGTIGRGDTITWEIVDQLYKEMQANAKRDTSPVTVMATLGSDPDPPGDAPVGATGSSTPPASVTVMTEGILERPTTPPTPCDRTLNGLNEYLSANDIVGITANDITKHNKRGTYIAQLVRTDAIGSVSHQAYIKKHLGHPDYNLGEYVGQPVPSYEIPPCHLWPNIIPTIRLVQEIQLAIADAIGDSSFAFEIYCGYRSPMYNAHSYYADNHAKLGDAWVTKLKKTSSHQLFTSLDVDLPEGQRTLKMRRLFHYTVATVWLKMRSILNLGIGFYDVPPTYLKSQYRIHIEVNQARRIKKPKRPGTWGATVPMGEIRGLGDKRLYVNMALSDASALEAVKPKETSHEPADEESAEDGETGGDDTTSRAEVAGTTGR